MPQRLELDSATLFMAADHLDMHEFEHVEAHSAANAAMTAAGPGWVGTSATALSAKLPSLESMSTHIAERLAAHRDALRAAGHRYQDVDADSSTDIGTTPQTH